MALADAFTPPRPHPPSASVSTPVAETPAAAPPPAATPAPAPVTNAAAAAATPFVEPHVYPPLGVPFWGKLRGHFDLKLDSIVLKPYRIDGVRGRLALTDRALVTLFSGPTMPGLHRIEVRMDDTATADEDVNVFGLSVPGYDVFSYDIAFTNGYRDAFTADEGVREARHAEDENDGKQVWGRAVAHWKFGPTSA